MQYEVWKRVIISLRWTCNRLKVGRHASFPVFRQRVSVFTHSWWTIPFQVITWVCSLDNLKTTQKSLRFFTVCVLTESIFSQSVVWVPWKGKLISWLVSLDLFKERDYGSLTVTFSCGCLTLRANAKNRNLRTVRQSRSQLLNRTQTLHSLSMERHTPSSIPFIEAEKHRIIALQRASQAMGLPSLDDVSEKRRSALTSMSHSLPFSQDYCDCFLRFSGSCLKSKSVEEPTA